MINRASIIQWSKQVPWNDNAQIEQDLIISRALVAIFSDEFLHPFDVVAIYLFH